MRLTQISYKALEKLAKDRMVNVYLRGELDSSTPKTPYRVTLNKETKMLHRFGPNGTPIPFHFIVDAFHNCACEDYEQVELLIDEEELSK